MSTLGALVALAPTCAFANVVTCSLHPGMTIYFLDYADSDTTLSHPLGVASGKVDIHEPDWHKKCAQDGPNSKVFVPFNATSGMEKGQWDTRNPKGIYRTRAEAERAYEASR
jgi:hypothetical protein